MVLARLFRRSQLRDRARRLYGRAVEQARRPAFYRDCGVPDTLDGRFDMIVLHVLLILRRLRREGDEGGALGQAVFDVMMDDMDRSLREMGVGDFAVGRRVKAMVRAVYGRAAAYEAALAADDGALADALRRNLYGTVAAGEDDVAAIAAYVRKEAAALDAQAASDLLAGEFRFGRPARADVRGECGE
ncbi:MAG: ubiquinol-cytochrome C chaperone family protein [Alphaproteobacteria bacterium]